MYYVRNRGLRIKDFWFIDERTTEESGAAFAQYHDLNTIPENTEGLIAQQDRKTLVNNLLENEEEIISRFKKNTKYEIKRAAKEGCYSAFYLGKELADKKDILLRVDKAHAQMFADKGKKSKREFPTMMAAARADMLAVSIGYLPDGRECAYHVYIIGEKVARLLHSIAVFREVESNEDRNAIGRLNRYLHHEDMLKFKEQGYTTYDWGGYSEEEHLKSISDFKKAFGGEIIDVYTMVYATNPIGKLLAKFVKWLKY